MLPTGYIRKLGDGIYCPRGVHGPILYVSIFFLRLYVYTVSVTVLRLPF